MESSINLSADTWCTLGTDCVEKVFARLPTKDLVRARCLSKFWEKTIVSSRFVREIISVSGPKCAYTTFRNTFHSRSLDLWEGYDWPAGEWRLLFLFEPCPEYLDFLRPHHSSESFRPQLVSTSGNLFCFHKRKSYPMFGDRTIGSVTHGDIFVLDPVGNTFRTLPPLIWKMENMSFFTKLRATITIVDTDHYIVTMNGGVEDKIIHMFSSHTESWVTHERSGLSRLYLGARVYEKKLYFVSRLLEEPYNTRMQLLLESYHVEDKSWVNPVMLTHHFRAPGPGNCTYGKVLLFTSHGGLMLAQPIGRCMCIFRVHDDGSMVEIARSEPQKKRCYCGNRDANLDMNRDCNLHYFLDEGHMYVVFSCIRFMYKHALCYNFSNGAWTNVLHNVYIKGDRTGILSRLSYPELKSIPHTPFVYGVNDQSP